MQSSPQLQDSRALEPTRDQDQSKHPYETYSSASPKVSHKRVFTLIRWQPGSANTGFCSTWAVSSCEFRASIARTPFCAILWRSPSGRYKRLIQKGTKSREETKGRFCKRAVLANVPSLRFLVPSLLFCTPVPFFTLVPGLGVQGIPAKTTLLETTLLRTPENANTLLCDTLALTQRAWTFFKQLAGLNQPALGIQKCWVGTMQSTQNFCSTKFMIGRDEKIKLQKWLWKSWMC